MKGLIDFEPDAYYHLVNHAVGSESLFRNDDNYRYFLNKYAHYMPSVCSTIAYCLMPNHVHFLIKTHSENVLAIHPKYKKNFHKLVMQEWSNLLNAYAKAYNKVYERKGALWIDYSKRFRIESEIYLINVINYIHQNPIKHGFVKNTSDWAHSSFNSLLSSKPTRLERDLVMQWFGNHAAFIEYHTEQTTQLISEWEYKSQGVLKSLQV